MTATSVAAFLLNSGPTSPFHMLPVLPVSPALPSSWKSQVDSLQAEWAKTTPWDTYKDQNNKTKKEY